MKDTIIRLENTRGHFKFWEASIKHRVVRVYWGRIGHFPQSKRYAFSTNVEAQDFVDRKVTSKIGRGYRVDRRNISVAAMVAA